MPNVHRRISGLLTRDPDDPAAKPEPCVLSLHFTTANPFEVRLRLPIEQVFPTYTPSRTTYVRWVYDRWGMRASTRVRGLRFGGGDVTVGSMTSWMALLHKAGRTVVVSAPVGQVDGFLDDVDRLCPDPEVDVDEWLAELQAPTS